MFANFLYGSIGSYFLTQLNDCGAIIKVRRNYAHLGCNRIVATIMRHNTVHLLNKNMCSNAKKHLQC